MRLICPNCSAQYEIDASLIPDEGRDVQCSNCGHTWFELPPAPAEFTDAPEPVAAVEPEAELETEGEDLPVQEPDEEPEPASLSEADEEPEPDEPAPDLTPEAVERDEPGDREPSAAARAIAAAGEKAQDEAPVVDPFAAAAAAGEGFKKRRPVADDALDILRQEADREMAQRRAPPTTPLETQTDLPLDEVRKRATPSRALRARMARPEGDDDGPPKKAAKQPARGKSADEGYEAPRRDLLPDIEEINSSLKSRKGRAEARPAEVQRGGFRAGFLLMVLLAVLMIFAYAWAPNIAAAVPSLEGPLLVYVDWANAVRDWIDGAMSG